MNEKKEPDWYETVGYQIEVTKENECRAFHSKGQKFVLNNYTTPEGLCVEAFHAMYPLLFAGRIGGDFSNLGAQNPDKRIFKCPAREIHFAISRFYQCNNCGKKVNKQDLQARKKKYPNFTLDILACSSCAEKLEET